jgi:hypothetical protein
MLKKTITYTTFDDNEITEDFYFNLSKRELVILQLSMPDEDGIAGHWTKVVASGDGAKIMQIFDDLIIRSYGRRTEDGKSFVKDEVSATLFKHSAAYDTLFMELVTDAKAGAEFFKGVVPSGLAEEALKEAQRMQGTETVELPEDDERTKLEKAAKAFDQRFAGGNHATGMAVDMQAPAKFPTKAQLLAMTPEEIVEAAGRSVGRDALGRRTDETLG